MSLLTWEGEVLLVTLPEEIDHYQTPTIAMEIDEAILSKDTESILFDFANTKFMDSSGIGLLVGRYKKIESMGGGMKLMNVNSRMAKILHLSGIEKIIGKYEEAK